jgi:ABC-type uncharacterized transport system auxiliary subunit
MTRDDAPSVSAAINEALGIVLREVVTWTLLKI